MRKVGLLLAISMVLAPTSSMTEPYATTYIVEPGDVVKHVSYLDPSGPRVDSSRITGSVRLVANSSGKPANTGGGCLVYLSERETPNTCTADSDCVREYPHGGAIGRGTAEYGYCAPMDRNPSSDVATREKKCWYQPRRQSCYRSPDQPLEENHVYKFPPTSLDPPGVGRPILWRVVSCQNLVYKGCSSGDPKLRQYLYGTIRRFE